ncbi:MAG: hypothetical protein J7L76_03210 [Spirochaetaceae bacterium]|nr:hypothetical protein [Spirochaetaceae bacterium]
MSIQEIYKQFKEEVQFLSIYIREAHPIDGWWMGRRLTKKLMLRMAPKVSMEHYDPKTIEERRAVAGECETALQYGTQTYIDEMDDHVNDTYAAWPTRLYLVGLDGKIVYGGGLGPYDFKPSKLKAAIEEYLKELSTS